MTRSILTIFLVLLMATCTVSSWAALGDVAIFSEGTIWISKEDADVQRAIVFDDLKGAVSSVGEVVYATDAEIGPWAEERIDDGVADILVIFGWFPTTLYTPGNSQVDDSIAERFLYGGNIILNCADYVFYITEGGGVNGENGLKTIININADMWGGGTQITPTADGERYTPTLGEFTSERPFKTEQIVDPWSVEAIFGDNGAGFFDPGIIKLNDSSGRVGICMQEPNNGDLPRGQVLIEMINFISQQPDILAGTTPADVNSDGSVTVEDLAVVAIFYGTTLTPGASLAADANGDGVVDIKDLILVAGEIDAAAGGPALSDATPHTLPENLTPENLAHWVHLAKQIEALDAHTQNGIRVLEKLLEVLTLAEVSPKETALLPNYPNPFNPETWIPYQLSEPTDVTLHIYAVDGSLVRTLSLGHKAIGMYQTRSRAVYWDGRNAQGEPVASGVYFYTLSAGDFTATRKMLIRK